MLTDAGLKPDWMTLYVGWRGIDLRPWAPLSTSDLPFADVQAYAIDTLITVVGTLWEHDVFRIVDAERAHDVEDSFLRLAAASDNSEALALRKWRYATTMATVSSLTGSEIYIRLDDDDYINDDGNYINGAFICSEMLYELFSNWSRIVPENPLPDVDITSDAALLEQYLTAYRKWCTVERPLLLA